MYCIIQHMLLKIVDKNLYLQVQFKKIMKSLKLRKRRVFNSQNKRLLKKMMVSDMILIERNLQLRLKLSMMNKLAKMIFPVSATKSKKPSNYNKNLVKSNKYKLIKPRLL